MRTCDSARASLVAGRDAAAHVEACAECRRFAASLGRVDAALQDAADDAVASPLPAALRARIVAAARTGAATAPRGRLLLLDWTLRAAAAAAVLVAGAWLVPQPLFAEDVALTDVRPPSLGIAERVEATIAAVPRFDEAPPVELPVDPVAGVGAAAALLAAAWWFGTRRSA